MRELRNAVKTLAFAIGMLIAAFGAAGILAPWGLVWVAQHAVTSGVFYVVAVVRLVFGLTLISVASVSRAPQTIRVLGYVILIAAIATALTGAAAIDRARTVIEWWVQQGSVIVGLTGVLVMALGGFVAYACAPARRDQRGR